jgi:cellulose synthase/poly-beta-1,6-N-acetylglucosamine synthase-like glycosyltransferase
MSFRKQAYDSVGGYRSMGFTIIEDFALMRQLVNKTEWQVLYAADKEMLVISKPMPDLPAFYEQRKRWSAGGKEVGWYGKFLMSVSFVSHLSLFAAWILSPGLQTFLLTLLVLAVDFLLQIRSAKRFDRLDLMKYFLFWEAFYFVYTSFFAPVLLLPTTVKWKDVRYKWQFDWRIDRVDEEI